MFLFKKIKLFFKKILKVENKNLFYEQLSDTKQNEKRLEFLESLSVTEFEEAECENSVRTMFCSGNGLGIQKKFTY